MAEAARVSISTILFTDVVDSTVLMQRLGDERAQRVFEGHHRMLVDTLAASGGEELKWLGDGQMAAFASPADAVRCAVTMQQAAVRQIDGERLRIRVGLNVGEIMRGDGGRYFGIPPLTSSAALVRVPQVPSLADTFRVLAALRTDAVIREYAVGGAMAMLFWTEPTLTFDLDVFVLLPAPEGPIVSLSPLYDWL